MKKGNTILTSILVIGAVILFYYGVVNSNFWFAFLSIVTFVLCLLFYNLDKIESLKLFSNTFPVEAKLWQQKVESDIKEISKSLPSWELLLEHDEEGNRIDGDVQDLIRAVYEGYPIKIRIKRSDSYFEVMDAQWLFVDKDKDLVHASNTSQISIHRSKDKPGYYCIPEDPYYYFYGQSGAKP